MGFVSLIFMYLVIILAIVCVITLIGVVLFIVSAVMKKKQLTKKRNAEMAGDYSYRMKKTYIIPRVFGFIFMIPLILCIIAVLYVAIGFVTNNVSGQKTQYLKTREEIMDETAMTIFKALENEDAETIKALFSKEALEQAENIDDEIQAAIDFFEGSVPEGSMHDISIPGLYPAHHESASTRKGITVIQNEGTYYIATDKARYAMRVVMCSRSEGNPDAEGVVLIEILPTARIKWQASVKNGDVGVFIQDEEPITEEIGNRNY